ncbi:FAD-binding oxidoreductase [Mesobaculum littorinae]|uniref:FAD-binding oxidoreductase n=1 Tax=Mesobaculum littorinae TaxID=2486419 RepID=A0A438AIN3_9RHOB|nr:FAD-binding oxidoreductase [Mesobaculum littorinae]RVV98524.1 FAD-binding oxidoreductase [Mesobaculum littorinae]
MRWSEGEWHGWGRALRAHGRLARPEKRADLAAILHDMPCPAIGNARSYGDACLNGDGAAIRMTRLDRVSDFDPETGELTAEAGVTLGALLRLFAPRGWMPPVLPGTGAVTLGGAIANDVHGKNHHGAGSFGQHVTWLRLLGADGVAREVRPGSDLFRATVGGLGQTGVILDVGLRLAPCPGQAVQVRESRIAGLDTFLDRLGESRATYCVGWIDATARGAGLGRGILEEAEIAAGAPPPVSPRAPATVPFDAPGALLSAPVVRAFNAAYLSRVPADGRDRQRALPEFFFPLDRISAWNRLYGRRGFHQFQCVLPHGSDARLRELLEDVAASKLASPLAVLKRLGDGRAGDLSFPMAGWTLALDLRNRPEAAELIDRLEARVVASGGRVYLAKDALAAPERVARMYPALSQWADAVRQADPDGVFATDLVRRLRLREASE